MARVQHVIPVADDREHSESPYCWCGPDAEPVGESMLYVHNSRDRREVYERATGDQYRGKKWMRVEIEE